LVSTNISNIAVNSDAIATNASDIGVNSDTLDVHFGLVSTNISDIAVNSDAIAVNASDIGVNSDTLDVHFGLVSTNISDIAVNSDAIAVNASDIGVNSDTLDVHFGLVSTNISDIAVNSDAIATNAAGISANSDTLDVHFGLVSGNISDIADIQTNGIVGIIEKKSDGIHIGEDSLVTNLNEDTGAQDIWALNDGSLTDINFLSDVNVVSKLTVQAEAADSKTVITPATEIKPPYLNEDGIVADTVAVYTETGSVAVTTTNFDNSGVVATANGDLSLFASGGTQDVTSYVTAVRADIWDETQGDNAGFLAGPEVEVGGYIDMDGNFIELGVLDGDGVLDLDGLSSEELAMITVAGDPLPGGGGNLVVEGNARVDGALTLGSIADVEQSILDEVAARAAADDVLAAAINAEEVARATADDALQGGIDEVASNLADEAAARAAADADIVAGYMAADAAIVSGYMAADSSIVAGYMAADQMLAARISSVEDKVESNTRGIAMVAAMTSPTVREGMENALDFSLAHFDGETGAAISYARRVNENVQLNIAAASDTDFEETVVRGGVSLQW
ncbi:MAG: YadA-like family protein, partial [Puniceicoccaceae bacterium]